MSARTHLRRLLPALLLGLGLGAGVGGGLSGCSFTPALQQYCEETELCFCEGDDCCIKPGNTCEEGLCCGRLTCGDGFCVQGENQPFLSIDPTLVEFGLYDTSSVEPAPFKVFVLTNVGTQPTAPLQRRIRGASSDLSITDDTCIDRVLGPGESCTLRVDVTPVSTGFKEMLFGYFEAPDVDVNAVARVVIR